MSDLREALDRRAKTVHADREALLWIVRRTEHRRRNRRITAAVLALTIAGAGSLGAYLGIARGVQTPTTNGPSPTPSLFGQKTVTVDGVPFTISRSSSTDGPCIGVSAPRGTVGGCGTSEEPFQVGEGGLRISGRLYNIAYGEAPPGASRMEVLLGDGSTLTADTTYGLWLVVVRATEGDASSDFTTVKAEDEAGNVLAQVDLPSLAAERRAAPPSTNLQISDAFHTDTSASVPGSGSECGLRRGELTFQSDAMHIGGGTQVARVQIHLKGFTGASTYSATTPAQPYRRTPMQVVTAANGASGAGIAFFIATAGLIVVETGSPEAAKQTTGSVRARLIEQGGTRRITLRGKWSCN